VQVFDFVNNHQFQFLKYFRIRELPVLVFNKKVNKSTACSSYFKNLKTLVVCMEELIKNQYLIGSYFDSSQCFLSSVVEIGSDFSFTAICLGCG
jgi:hypothetical protein